MARKFGDLDEYWSPGLVLTVRGREYTVPLPSAELGLWCQRIASTAGAIHQASTEDEIQAAVEKIESLPELDGEDLTLAQRLLGPVYDQMVADKVPFPYIEFCGSTAYVWVVAGEEAAERYWTSGGRPEAVRPVNRAQRRAAARATGRTGTAGASATRSQASTSGTRSPKKSVSASAAKRTRGRRS